MLAVRTGKLTAGDFNPIRSAALLAAPQLSQPQARGLKTVFEGGGIEFVVFNGPEPWLQKRAHDSKLRKGMPSFLLCVCGSKYPFPPGFKNLGGLAIPCGLQESNFRCIA